MLKKIFTLFCAGMMFAAPATASLCEIPIGESAIQIYTDGDIRTVPIEAPAFIGADSRTMVPVRAAAEALGATVTWTSETKTVCLTKGDAEITLTIGSLEARKNGAALQLDTPPVIINDRTMVPIRFLAEALEIGVSYLDFPQSVLLDSTEVLLFCGETKIRRADIDTLYALIYRWNEAAALEGKADMKAFAKDCLVAALDKAAELAQLENAFPEVVMDGETLAIAKTEAAALGTLTYMPIDAKRDEMLERMYRMSAGPIYNYFMQCEEDYKAKYAKEYAAAKHVLCTDEAEAKLVYEKAISGESFDDLISAYNEDPGMEGRPDGYIFTYGEMVKPFETATFAAGENEITPPVKTDYGYHVILRLPLPAFDESMLLQMIEKDIDARIQKVEPPRLLQSEAKIMEMYGMHP